MKAWRFSLVICCLFVGGLAAVTPDPVSTTPDEAAPLEFPNFNQNYTFVDNSSIRENLASHSGIDIEVPDLLTKDDALNDFLEYPSPRLAKEEVEIEDLVELIEDGEDTEDERINRETTTTEESTSTTEESTTLSTTPETTPKVVEAEVVAEAATYKDGVPLVSGSVAAILVVVFLVVCIFGYTGLIVWRRALESFRARYGSREMLVDKDDMYDPDDIRHFSI